MHNSSRVYIKVDWSGKYLHTMHGAQTLQNNYLICPKITAVQWSYSNTRQLTL